MEPRDLHLLQSRPEICDAGISSAMCADEKFQNETLRPVIKLQNDLLVAAFRNYIQKHKNAFHDMSIEKRLLFIENSVQKDIKFRNSLKGMIIGQFTLPEYEFYISNSSALNKRMMSLVKDRIKNSIQLLDPLSAA